MAWLSIVIPRGTPPVPVASPQTPLQSGGWLFEPSRHISEALPSFTVPHHETHKWFWLTPLAYAIVLTRDIGLPLARILSWPVRKLISFLPGGAQREAWEKTLDDKTVETLRRITGHKPVSLDSEEVLSM